MVAILINEFLKVTVKSSGAELISIKNTLANKEYLWQGDPAYWARRAPVLFPIVGKVKDNKYIVNGKTYQLPQHGFARDAMFNTIDQQNTSLTFILKSNEETLKNYPFEFSLTVKYSLDRNRVIVDYIVENTDNKIIYFSIGAHPAFICPFESEESISDCYIEFEKTEQVSRTVLKEGLITDVEEPFLNDEKTILLSNDTFEKDAIILKNLKSKQVSLRSHKSKHYIKLNFEGFPYLALWSKYPTAPFICLEPWFGISDKVNFSDEISSKEGILSLEKGEIFQCSYSIEVYTPK